MSKKGSFYGFLFSSRRVWLILIPALVGVLLLLGTASLGSLPKEESGASEIEQLCSSIEGVGECRVMLSYAQDGRTVVAVAVVCDGGDSVTVRHRLTELLSSFYGIGYHRISIERSGNAP